MRAVGALITAGLALMLAGQALAGDMNPDGYYIRHTHDFEQDVSGEGYVMVYQDVNTNNLSLNNYMHGSGAVDSATLISSEQKKSKTWYTFTSSSGWKKYKNYDSVATFAEQSEMVQSPEAFAYGTGWYEKNPVVYNSLLKEKTTARNYQGGASMQHQIEYARAFNKDISAELNCTGKTTENDGVGLARMRMEEDVTEGTVHVSELLTREDEGVSVKKRGGVKEPLILVDENYVGSFKIKKDMEINAVKGKSYDSSDWLPCCHGGFAGMDDYERLFKGQKGIFDCTCRETALENFSPEWNSTSAQFPTEEYRLKP